MLDGRSVSNTCLTPSKRYILPVLAVASEVELARHTDAQVTAVVAVCLVVAGPDHVGLSTRELLDLAVEVIEDPVVLGTVVGEVVRGDIAALLLLDPGVGVSKITNWQAR